MNRYSSLDIDGYEEVIRCDNEDIGFTAWIAIHNSMRGPALGGCRVWHYAAEEAALTDVLRLSRAMTYKNALALLPLGGGKSVVHTDLNTVDRKRLFEAFGLFVETLQGRYITAEDVNSTLEDMAIIKTQTEHVATVGASGNPSPFTAYGVYCAIKASVRYKMKKKRLDGLPVAIQGIGETGARLAKLLHRDKCRITVADINIENIRTLKQQIEFDVVPPEEIYNVPCVIFSPCALGGILNSRTIPRLQCQIVVGSANNQLLTAEDGHRLYDRNILYGPDYAVNAGGVINISCEIGQQYDAEKARRLTQDIAQTLTNIYKMSDQQGLPTNFVADSLAEKRFDLATSLT
ncbi:MAG: Glu/Leu/Phe/Val family dehydrogenase [Desulforhopalus sp.]